MTPIITQVCRELAIAIQQEKRFTLDEVKNGKGEDTFCHSSDYSTSLIYSNLLNFSFRRELVDKNTPETTEAAKNVVQ